MTVATDDAAHERWRAAIDGLVAEWRSVVDVCEPDQADDLVMWEPAMVC